MSWTLNGNLFSTLGIVNASRNLINQGIDTVIFNVPGYLEDSPIAAHGEMVTIERDGASYFAGRINSPERSGSSSDESLSYRIDGPWWWFEKITYEQLWKMWSITQNKITDVYNTRCILNQADDGAKIKTGAQIRAAVELAILRGAPISIGTIDEGIDIPSTEETDIKVSELIIRQLRWTPDLVAWFDYSTGAAIFNVTARSDLPTVTWTIPTDMVTAIRFTARRDLVVPGVVLRYEQTFEQTGEYEGSDGEMYPIGQKFETINEDTAGDIENVERHLATFRLGGSAAHYVSQRIRTSEMPSLKDLDISWWARYDTVVSVSPVTVDGMTITWEMATVTYVEDHEFPRILKEGTIQPWMAKKGIASVDVEIVARFKIKITDSDGKNSYVEQERKLTKTLTNAATKVYYHLDNLSLDSEPVPENLAADLLASWSQLQYEGSAEITQSECVGGIAPGSKLNVIGGAPEWASMGAIIQSVDEVLETGKTTVTCGPAAHLGADDLITLFREQRKRQVSYAWVSRKTGLSDDHQISQAAPTVIPKNIISPGVQTPGEPPEGEEDPTDTSEFVSLSVMTNVTANDSGIFAELSTLRVPKGSTITSPASTQIVQIAGWSE